MILSLLASPGPAQAAYKPINQSINGSFELDSNHDGRPDFWEVSWRNGNSDGPYASRSTGLTPTDGDYVYRLYNGTGDAQSYQFARSQPIQIKKGGSYRVKAQMRYTLQTGGVAGLYIIHLDNQGNEISLLPGLYQDGGWNWHSHTIDVTALPQTTAFVIRLAVGGEEGAYLDVDQVQVEELTSMEVLNRYPTIQVWLNFGL